MLALLLLAYLLTPEPYAYHCATDGECYGEELAVFGTIDGKAPHQWRGTPSLTLDDVARYARFFDAHGNFDHVEEVHAPSHTVITEETR